MWVCVRASARFVFGGTGRDHRQTEDQQDSRGTHRRSTHVGRL